MCYVIDLYRSTKKKSLPSVNKTAKHGVRACALLLAKASVHAQFGVRHAHVHLVALGYHTVGQRLLKPKQI